MKINNIYVNELLHDYLNNILLCIDIYNYYFFFNFIKIL